jgi:hypothetical protein
MRSPPPILHDAYDLTLALYKLVPTFPRAQRFVLGQRIEHEAVELLFAIDAANDPARRRDALAQGSVALDHLRLTLRLATDLGFVPVSHHEALTGSLDALSRQLGGWIRWTAEASR